MTSRRQLIQKASLWLPLLALPGAKEIFAIGSKTYHRTYNSLAVFFKKYPIDEIDKKNSSEISLADRHREIHPYFQTELPKLVPPIGKIVELGVCQGKSTVVLKNIFNSQRYMGVDINPQSSAEGVVCADVRELADLENTKAAFVWNDVSSWEGSPRSRLAALNWAKRNLTTGGIYIDEAVERIPSDANYDGLLFIYKSKTFTVFQKV